MLVTSVNLLFMKLFLFNSQFSCSVFQLLTGWITAMQLVTPSKFTLQRCVYIASDGGRVCRPVVIADKGVSRIKEHHMKELKVFLIIGLTHVLFLLLVELFIVFF